ncbi:hypothetical protein PWG15_22570 (plasmid) [Ensifer adhaerens]|uniref:hypothetical protein n=1 Tax=Ensifer adhaerens TaxID=106592 RepID=UPI0023A9B378|nr:hypothetical protein [Ensifer adhaerens]WDZ80569.1 hypothetical protein PWG15_22570 [Ensifer adhaerens]
MALRLPRVVVVTNWRNYVVAMMSITEVFGPFALMGRLIARFWPQLLLIGTCGYIAHDLLMRAAVAIGQQHPLGGMVTLSFVVLAKLVVVVLMFMTLRPGLPALEALRQQPAAAEATSAAPKPDRRLLAVTAAAILPFFAYYAAWGFLGDTVREYSRLALDAVAFGEKADFFDILKSRGLLISIALCWLVRFGAKHMSKHSETSFWRLLVVAADASWIFIGLYGVSVWKDQFITWLGAGRLLSMNGFTFTGVAHAAETFVPVELRRPYWNVQAEGLFFYALLPIIWLVMAAIINGYELSSPAARAKPSSPRPRRVRTLRKWIADFLEHFVSDYRSRYAPIWTCLKLTLGSGLATLFAFIIAYRAIAWAGAWIWYAATRTLGMGDLASWQLVFDALSLFIGSPSDLDGGIVLDALRITLLAAMLEHAVSRQAEKDEISYAST